MQLRARCNPYILRIGEAIKRRRQAFADGCILHLLRRNVVAEIHGIKLVSFRKCPEFVTATTASLELIRLHDPRRFRRVRSHIEWIVDHSHWLGGGAGEYHDRIKVCRVDFEAPPEERYAFIFEAVYAALIVHEATHGRIDDWLSETSSQPHERVERLCHVEEGRFLQRLKNRIPDLSELPILAFDLASYEAAWRLTPFQRFWAEIRRSDAR